MWYSRLYPPPRKSARAGQPRPRRRSAWRRPLDLERLEERLAPAAVQWVNSAGGDWAVGANWSGGAPPRAADDVTIPPLAPGAAVTHAAGNDSVLSLAGAGALELSGGSLAVGTNSTFAGSLRLDGGKLTGIGSLTVTGPMTWDSGTLSTQSRAATFTAAGGLALGTGQKVLDQRPLSVTGPLTWTGGDVVLQNGATWSPPASGLAPFAVLAVSGVSAPSLVVGDYSPITVGWTVSNTGSGPGVTGSWDDVVLATPDDTLGHPADEVELARFHHDGLLDHSAGYTRQGTFNLPLDFRRGAPQSLQGRFHLFVRADANSDVFMNQQRSMSAAAAPGPFDVSPAPFADLVVSQVTAPASAQAGQAVHVAWQVANQGIGITTTNLGGANFPVTVSWNDALALASDRDGKHIVANFGSFDHVGALSPGDSYLHSADVTLPASLAPGTYYLIVDTAGRGDPYEFVHDDNNRGASQAIAVTPGTATGPQLVVDPAVALPDLPVATASAVDVSWSVRNDGTADATGQWSDSVSLQKVGGGDSFSLGSLTFSGPLPAGKSYRRTGHFTLPAGHSGLYQAVVTTSGPGFASARSAGTVRIDAAPQPGLQVTSLTAPDTIRAGDFVAVDYTVTNLGSAAAGPQWQDHVYLSLDGQVTSARLLGAPLDNPAPLAPGESYRQHTASFQVPRDFGGPAFLVVQTGSNQTLSRPINVIPVAPADLVTSDVVAPDQAFLGSTIKVRYRVTNRGLGATDVSSWTDRIWLSHGRNRPDASPPATTPSCCP
jgi:hypothetical protein